MSRRGWNQSPQAGAGLSKSTGVCGSHPQENITDSREKNRIIIKQQSWEKRYGVSECWFWSLNMEPRRFQALHPLDPARTLASRPHAFGDVPQAAQTLNLVENFYILVYAPRQQNFFSKPWAGVWYAVVQHITLEVGSRMKRNFSLAYTFYCVCLFLQSGICRVVYANQGSFFFFFFAFVFVCLFFERTKNWRGKKELFKIGTSPTNTDVILQIKNKQIVCKLWRNLWKESISNLGTYLNLQQLKLAWPRIWWHHHQLLSWRALCYKQQYSWPWVLTCIYSSWC